MTDADYDALGQMLVDLSAIYGKPVTDNMIGMYYVSLVEYDLKDLRRAINIHVRNPDTGQFFPKPADIVRVMTGDTGTQSGLAWTKVLEAIRRVGAYSSVVFDDQIIHRVVMDMGGWPKLCECKEAETPFVGKDFERRYQGYASRRIALNNEYTAVLVGITDAQNIGKGYETSSPAMIGRRDACVSVMLSGCGSLQGVPISIGDASHVGNSYVGRSIRSTVEQQAQRSGRALRQISPNVGAGGGNAAKEATETLEVQERGC